MPITVGSNIAALRSIRLADKSSQAIGRTFERLSSGLRINRASDDAAGLAISTTLDARARVYSQGIRNTNDAVSALNIAGDTLSQFSNILTRVKELAEQAANGSYSFRQRLNMHLEGQKLIDEYNRILSGAKFNGVSLLGSGAELGVQLGFGSSESLRFDTAGELRRTVGGNTIATTSNPFSSVSHAVGDFNGDGKLDRVDISDNSAGYLYLGDGSGGFSTQSNITATNDYNAVEALDLNADGKLDIALLRSDGTVSLRLNDGSGNFTESSLTTVSGGGVSSGYLRKGDFNGDGNVDLAVFTDTDAVLLTGNGRGGVASKTNLSGVSLPTSGTLSVADINGDGKDDLLALSGAGLSILRSTGTGFAQSVLSAGAIDGVLGDFNGDGLIDVADLTSGGSLEVRQGNGDGTFGSATAAAQGLSGQLALAAYDINGDGTLDLFSTSGTESRVLTNRGNGQFDVGNSGGSGYGAFNVGFFGGDLDGKGRIGFIDGYNVYVLSTASTTNVQRFDLTSVASARSTLASIDAAINRVSLQVGVVGSSLSRLSSALGVLGGIQSNSLAASSRIKDADVASESAQLAAQQILQQAGVAVLAQASQQPALALQLLRG